MANKPTKRRKSGKKKAKATIAPFIGVVSSIAITPAMKTDFEAGASPNNVQYKQNVKYKRRELRKAVRDFNDNVDCVLIVTVGGLVAWEAANSVLDKPSDKRFVSLIGAYPDDASDRFFGGVSVLNPSNEARIQSLISDKNFSRDEICLFYNPNSEQRNKELGEWRGANPVPGGIDATGDNVSTKYGQAFGKIPDTVKAVIVTTDAHFQNTKDALIDAANYRGKFMCYPLKEYKNTTGTTKPLPGSTRFHGPALTQAYASGGLTSAYKLLGQRAATVITSGSKLNPLIVPADFGQPEDI
jgi:hypothetical protein